MERQIEKVENNGISSNALDISIEKLSQHAKNKYKFRKNPFLTSTGGIDSSDYTNKSIRRSQISQKTFYNVNFINSTAAGSNFTHCTFDNCSIKNANFQECVFRENEIKKSNIENPITHSNFNRSLFSDGFFISDTYFQHSIFRQTAFIDGILKNVTFYSSTLEDTVFSNVRMKNVRFNDLNIDYAVFENIESDNVILPFSQICFTFGLLPYLMKTNDTVYITSAQNSKGYIEPKEFLALLPSFEVYYSQTNNFFPLANIYLSLDEYDKAQSAILNGILLATTNSDFRQIKYLCKLIYTYSVFDFHQRKYIYDYINSHILFYDMNASLRYSYNTYKNEIYSFLFNNNHVGIIRSEIDILTNVYPNESGKLGILLSTIEQLIELGKSEKCEHSVLCRHNSAEELVVVIQDTYQALQIIIPAIYSILLGFFVLEEKWENRKEKRSEILNTSELKEIEMERARIKLEREKIALEKEKYELFKMQEGIEKEVEDLRKNIVNNRIDILEIKHISYGDIPPNVNKKIIQNSSKKLNG